jgi:hypothetical protein
MSDETRRGRRLARATPVEDWLRSAAVKGRIAGFWRAVGPLCVWLKKDLQRRGLQALVTAVPGPGHGGVVSG